MRTMERWQEMGAAASADDVAKGHVSPINVGELEGILAHHFDADLSDPEITSDREEALRALVRGYVATAGSRGEPEGGDEEERQQAIRAQEMAEDDAYEAGLRQRTAEEAFDRREQGAVKDSLHALKLSALIQMIGDVIAESADPDAVSAAIQHAAVDGLRARCAIVRVAKEGSPDFIGEIMGIYPRKADATPCLDLEAGDCVALLTDLEIAGGRQRGRVGDRCRLRA